MSSLDERPLILLAEDDRATRESVTLALSLEGYQVEPVEDGRGAISPVGANHLFILDVMMPHLDGLQVCRILRERGTTTPILLLTARTEIADRVAGLDAGADDYLVKPFALDELMARVRALLRRSVAPGNAWVDEACGVRIDVNSRRAWRDDRELVLSKTEFELLHLLVVNAGQVMTPTTIYERIWGYDFGPDSKNLAVYIGYLRRKLEDGNRTRLIQTVRSVGYTLRSS